MFSLKFEFNKVFPALHKSGNTRICFSTLSFNEMLAGYVENQLPLYCLEDLYENVVYVLTEIRFFINSLLIILRW